MEGRKPNIENRKKFERRIPNVWIQHLEDSAGRVRQFRHENGRHENEKPLAVAPLAISGRALMPNACFPHLKDLGWFPFWHRGGWVACARSKRDGAVPGAVFVPARWCMSARIGEKVGTWCRPWNGFRLAHSWHPSPFFFKARLRPFPRLRLPGLRHPQGPQQDGF
jgi:hypothetical protein